MSIEEQTFPLAQTALDWLIHGEKEKYELRPHGEEAIGLALKALFASGLEAKAPIQLLLGLATTLKEDWESPTAARLIVGVLQEHPKVKALLGIQSTSGPNSFMAKGKEFLDGQKTKIQAPKFGAKGPKGSIQIKDLMGPAGLRPGGKIR